MSQISPPHCPPNPQRDLETTLRFINKRKGQQLTPSPSTPAASSERPARRTSPTPAASSERPAASSEGPARRTSLPLHTSLRVIKERQALTHPLQPIRLQDPLQPKTPTPHPGAPTQPQPIQRHPSSPTEMPIPTWQELMESRPPSISMPPPASTPAAASSKRRPRPHPPSGPPPAHLFEADPAHLVEADPAHLVEADPPPSPGDEAVDTDQHVHDSGTSAANAADTFVDQRGHGVAPPVLGVPVGNQTNVEILAGLAINYIHTLVEGAQSSSSGSRRDAADRPHRVYQVDNTTRAKYHSNPNSDWAVRKRQRAAAHHARQPTTDQPAPPRLIPRIVCVGCDIATPAAHCSNCMCGPCCLASELSCGYHKGPSA